MEQRLHVVGDVVARERERPSSAPAPVQRPRRSRPETRCARPRARVLRARARWSRPARSPRAGPRACRNSRAASSAAVPAIVSTTSRAASVALQAVADRGVDLRLGQQRLIRGPDPHHRGRGARSALVDDARRSPSRSNRAITSRLELAVDLRRRRVADRRPRGPRPACSASAGRPGVSGYASWSAVDRGRAEHRGDGLRLRLRSPARPSRAERGLWQRTTRSARSATSSVRLEAPHRRAPAPARPPAPTRHPSTARDRPILAPSHAPCCRLRSGRLAWAGTLQWAID